MAGMTADKPRTAGEVPDYTEDPAAFLLYHGWKPLGPAKSHLTDWIDGTKPWPDGVWSEIPVMSADQDGNVSPQMTKNAKGQHVQVKQKLYSPPAEPMRQETAVRTQVERDMRKEHQRLRDEARARGK